MYDGSKLEIFNIIEKTVEKLESERPLYEIVTDIITSKLRHILDDYSDELVDIHTRVKSPVSLKEKIIRNKLYKNYPDPDSILNNLSDIIGIMIECRFNKNEEEIFALIKEKFCKPAPGGYSETVSDKLICLNLADEQPQKQKNGQLIYKIDGRYDHEGRSFNFEVQIKSLVNTFWSEIEHKIVYKNNLYIPNHSYIMEMLAAVKGNLVGIDKILQLVSDQIMELGAERSNRPADINFVIAKLISDTFIAKMSESIGFTVDFKRICNLISGYLLNKYKDLPVREAQASFISLVNKFNDIYKRDIDWEKEIYLEKEYAGPDKFCQILGDRLISYMNSDFEWHVFFLILFNIESHSNNIESFTDFMNELKKVYSDKKLYEKLFTAFDEESAGRIYEEVTEFMAYTLSASASLNIIDSIDGSSDEIDKLINETVNYIISSFKSYGEFTGHRKAIQMMMLDKWSIN